MTRLPALTPDTARGKARDPLAELVERHGTVGAMVGTMANSPAVLSGYLDLSRAMKRSKLNRAITERISLAAQEHLGCELCLAAHTEAARSVGLSEDEVTAARQELLQTPPPPRSSPTVYERTPPRPPSPTTTSTNYTATATPTARSPT